MKRLNDILWLIVSLPFAVVLTLAILVLAALLIPMVFVLRWIGGTYEDMQEDY